MTAQPSIVCIDSPCGDIVTSVVDLSVTSILRYEYMDVDVVMISDDDMRIDDVIVTSNVSEAAVGPATPTGWSKKNEATLHFPKYLENC